MGWHLPPAMLKGWFDRVLTYGAAYTSGKRFEDGRFAGKRAMLSVTVGTSRDTYAFNGSGDIDLLLWPVNFNLAYVGFAVIEPYVVFGVEAGLRYSDPSEVRMRVKRSARDFRTMLSNELSDRATVSFNRKGDCSEGGRISPVAPSFAPFMRHRAVLNLG